MCDTSDGDVLSSTGGRHEPTGGVWLALTVSLGVILIDQLTKWWAVSRLEEGACTPATCIEIFGTPMRFRLLYNTGAAFSRGADFGPIIGVVAVVMSAYLFYLASRSTDRVMVVLFGVVAGGAIGNLIDRLARADDGFLSGGVVDFVDVRFWPVFNIADAAIVCGVIALALRQYTTGSATDDEPGSG